MAFLDISDALSAVGKYGLAVPNGGLKGWRRLDQRKYPRDKVRYIIMYA